MENEQNFGDQYVFELLDGEVIDWDEIVDIKYIGEQDTIDINVTGDRLFWANDILTHNSAIEANGEFDHSHIAGGISKINTADNVFGIFTTAAMRERGEYRIQMLKTRSSSAVGQHVELAFDTASLRLSDPDPDTEVGGTTNASSISTDLKTRSQTIATKVEQVKEQPKPVTETPRTTQLKTNMMDILNKVRKG